MKLEMEHQQQILSLKEDNASASQNEGAAVRITKMPKLAISKFDGTPQDCVRFWGQFSSQIDCAKEPAITKFSCLKELVDIKVRKLVDGLPFTEDGYHKAKALLEKRYGQTSEVVHAYIRNILEFPTIRERDVTKIHDFYEKLLFNVESLQTLKKLNEIDAAARFTFDKLEVMKNELALIDENWRNWTFKELLDTLEKWTINNPVQSSKGPFQRDRFKPQQKSYRRHLMLIKRMGHDRHAAVFIVEAQNIGLRIAARSPM